MSLFKRAATSVMRQQGKSAFLLILIFILGTALSGAISIRNAIRVTEERIWMQMPAIATVNLDTFAAIFDGVFHPLFARETQPTREEIATIGNSSHVRAYDFFFNPRFFSSDLSWAAMDIDESRLPSGVNIEMLEREINGISAWGGTLEMFTGRGVANPDLTDIEANLITLMRGRTFTQEEIDNDAMVVIVSRMFAEINNLSIGSIIELENIVHNYPIMFSEGTGNWMIDRAREEFMLVHRKLEVEVIGIFDIESEFIYENYLGWQFNAAIGARSLLYNRIYMPIGIAENMIIFESEALLEIVDEIREIGPDFVGLIPDAPEIESLFILYDPRNLDIFSLVAEEMLPDFWIVQDLSSNVEHVIASMDSMLEIADFIQWTAAGASIIVLTLIIVLFLRDRRHEIGTYMALGERRGRVIIQILIEVGVVAVVAIVLALFAGYFLSNTVSTALLEQQLIDQMSEGESNQVDVIPWQLVLFNPGQMTVEETLELYRVSLDMTKTVRFVGIGVVVILASVALPIWYVIKLEPKEVLL